MRDIHHTKENGDSNYQANLKIVDIQEAELKSAPHNQLPFFLPIPDFQKQVFLKTSLKHDL